MRESTSSRLSIPLRIAGIYVILGALWIFFSDKILVFIDADIQKLMLFQTIKGVFYVAVTGYIIYVLVDSNINKIRRSEEELKLSNRRLEETNRQLTEAKEEIFCQLEELQNQDLQLREITERYELAFKGSNDGLWDWDARSDRFFYSDRWVEMLGYSNNEVGDTLKGFEGLVHPEDLPEVRRLTKEHLEGKTRHYEAEFRMLGKNGKYVWILSRGQAIRDEKGNIVRAVGSHKDITERKIAEEKLKRNIDEARSFQEKLMPSTFPEIPGMRLHARYLAAKKVGGDLYDVYYVGGKLLVLISDVCGNGVPAAMMATYVKASIRHSVLGDGITDPARLVSDLARMVCNEGLFDEKFLTVFICTIDPDTLQMTYANAGQCYPALWRKGALSFINSSEFLISTHLKGNTYTNFGLQLEKGDSLLFYTDGIYEWEAADGFFGYGKFQERLVQRGLSEASISEIIREAGLKNADSDDITYVLLEISDEELRR